VLAVIGAFPVIAVIPRVPRATQLALPLISDVNTSPLTGELFNLKLVVVKEVSPVIVVILFCTAVDMVPAIEVNDGVAVILIAPVVEL
jgi:hypothetical protein